MTAIHLRRAPASHGRMFILLVTSEYSSCIYHWFYEATSIRQRPHGQTTLISDWANRLRIPMRANMTEC